MGPQDFIFDNDSKSSEFRRGSIQLDFFYVSLDNDAKEVRAISVAWEPSRAWKRKPTTEAANEASSRNRSNAAPK
jgi:hypothetical protein